MKLFTFYFLILLPIPFIFFLAKLGDTFMFFSFIGLYVFIYRPYIEGNKLMKKGIVEKKDIWKIYVPFYSLYYFDDIFFRK